VWRVDSQVHWLNSPQTMNEFRSPKDMATPTSKAGRRNGTFQSVAGVEDDGAYHEG